MPTLTAAAGADLPDVKIDGRNMLSLIADDGEFSREDNALYWQSGYLQVVRAGEAGCSIWLMTQPSKPT